MLKLVNSLSITIGFNPTPITMVKTEINKKITKTIIGK
jgi:hypothetical protein